MKSLLVLSVLTSAAFAIPAVDTWKGKLPQYFVREKKSTIDDILPEQSNGSDLPVEENMSSSRTFHKHHGLGFKKPIITKPHYDKHHSYYRDMEEGINHSNGGKDVEKFTEIDDVQGTKRSSPGETGIHIAKNVLSKVQKGFSNLEHLGRSHSLNANTENVSKNDGKRMAQWKETADEIQKGSDANLEHSDVNPSSHIHKQFKFNDDHNQVEKHNEEKIEKHDQKQEKDKEESNESNKSNESNDSKIEQAKVSMESDWKAKNNDVTPSSTNNNMQVKPIMNLDGGMAKHPTMKMVNMGRNANQHLLNRNSNLHATARGAYGIGQAANSGAYTSSSSANSASSGAVGMFPNANVGGCAVPILLSCSPSVVSGSLANTYHAPSYSAKAYRMLGKRDIMKTETIPDFKLGKFLPTPQFI